MIVFEGADGAGKSTLARAVAQRLLAEQKLRRFESYGLLPPWWDYSTHYWSSCKEFAVLDRFVVSEFVYGRLWRGGPNPKLMYNGNMDVLAGKMETAKSMTVYVRPDYDVCLARLHVRGDDLLDEADLTKLYKMYDEYLLRRTCLVTQSPVLVIGAMDTVSDVNYILRTYERRVAE